MIKPSLCGTALLLLSLTAPSFAQTAPCMAANDQNTSVAGFIYASSTAAPGKHAWQITPTAVTIAQSIRIYTGNNYTSSTGPFMSLEIWDDDPVNPGQPGSRLGGGTWQTEPVKSWQGTNLDDYVIMQPATDYWIVLVEPGWSTPPVEVGGGTMMPYMNGTTGSWIGGTAQALKYRLYCGLLDEQGLVSFGSSCAGSSGAIGTAFAQELPTIGNATFRIEGTGFDAGVPIINVFGITVGFPSVPIPGTASCFANTTADVILNDITGTGDVRASTASGHVAFDFAIPANPALVGFYFASQLAALDVNIGTSLPLVTSNAMRVTVF
jgi:hypothetical protein